MTYYSIMLYLQIHEYVLAICTMNCSTCEIIIILPLKTTILVIKGYYRKNTFKTTANNYSMCLVFTTSWILNTLRNINIWCCPHLMNICELHQFYCYNLILLKLSQYMHHSYSNEKVRINMLFAAFSIMYITASFLWIRELYIIRMMKTI